MISDEMLMLEFQAGSREAFNELFGRYKVQVYAFFRRRVRSSEIAEDLAQETWMAVLKGKERYQPVAPFRTYLYAIAFKVLAGERRRSGSEKAKLAEEKYSGREAIEAGRWVREALEKLDAMDREILMLREYEELSYSEIAELLQVPVNTVRSRLFRARVALKQLLEPTSETVPAQVNL